MDLEEWVLGKKREPREHRSIRKYLAATILIAVVATSFLAIFTFYSNITQTKALPDGLAKIDVQILPRQCKLYPGETQLFVAQVSNGTAPFMFTWEANGTNLGHTPSITFGFEQQCEYVVLSVQVWDANSNYGFDGVLVYDPAFPAMERYFEIPASAYTVVIETNTTHAAWYNGSSGKRMGFGSNKDSVIESALANMTQGIMFVKAGNYSGVSVTISNSTVLMLEVGVTDFVYTTPGTGIALKFASGYVWVDAPLNMTGHQILFGVFHSGSTAPANPTTGQPFFDTDDFHLYIYNGTAWEDYSGAGAQGPAGPAGAGNFGDYTFICYYNSTAATYQFRDWQGQLQTSNTDAELILEWAWGNLTSGRTWYETVVWAGNFTIDGTLSEPTDWTVTRGTPAFIKLADGADCDILSITNRHHIQFYDVTFDGNEANQGETAGLDGLYFSGVDYFHLERVTVQEVQRKKTPSYDYDGKAFRITSCENSTLRDCSGLNNEVIAFHISGNSYNIRNYNPTVLNNEREGGTFYSSAKWCYIIGGVFQNNGDNGFDFYGTCDHCYLIGVTFRDNTNDLADGPTHGSGEISVSHAGDPASFCGVYDCYIYCNGISKGVRTISESNNCTFQGVYVYESYERGFEFAGYGDHSVIGCHIINPGQHGILVRADSNGSLFNSNYIYGIPSGYYAIWFETSEVGDNVAIGNYIHNTVSGRGILDSGDNHYRDNYHFVDGWLAEG